MIKLFDSHCHLQDPRIFNRAPQVIKTALDTGVLHFVVNGVSEKDWHLVKEMSEKYPSVVPSFGLHPWFITERTPHWMNSLKEFFESTPSAAVGEMGLDKGSHGKKIDFTLQVEVFRQQLQLAKELNRPASVHCVRAFGDLLEIMKSVGPFPAGVILHSFLGSAEMVPELSKLGAYFSFSGFLMSLKETKAKKMLKAVPSDRILLETDAPDALPKVDNLDSLFLVEGDESISKEARVDDATDSFGLPKETLNQPANIHIILEYVASLLEMSKEEVADVSYRNAMRLFSYEGSKVLSPEWYALRDQPSYGSQVEENTGSGSSGSKSARESDVGDSNSVGSIPRRMGREAGKKKGKKKDKREEVSEVVNKEWSEFKQFKEKEWDRLDKIATQQEEANKLMKDKNQAKKMKLWMKLSEKEQLDDRSKQLFEMLSVELFGN